MLIMLTATNLSAAPLNLAQAPAGNSGSEPAPNVILSVDDSGSMGWDENGCLTPTSPASLGGNEGIPGVTCPTQNSNTNQTRLTILRQALISQFGNGTANSGLVADGRIRLAWQAMWDNGGTGAVASVAPNYFPATPGINGNITAGSTNSMKRFAGQHRVAFNTFINSLTPGNGTPSTRMMSQAFNYMNYSTRAGSINSPWASNPGVTELPYLACRRTYHVLMTDGAWNLAERRDVNARQINGGNALRLADTPNFDGSTQTLPSPDASLNLTPSPPTTYTPNTAQTRVYSDNWGASNGNYQQASTLSDYAFRNWATDLSPMPNAITPKIRVEGTEAATGLQEFWNPQNDPATWQHITQHTIGFGRSATTWPTTGNLRSPAWSGENHSGAGYMQLVNGTETWGNPIPWALNPTNGGPDNGGAFGNDSNAVRTSELWHAALNGRGKYYPTRNAAGLTAAFNDILDNILSDTSSQPTSISSNGASLSANSKSYVAGYDAKKWSGSLKAFPINATTGVVGTTETWSATGLGAFDANKKFIVNDPGKLDDPNYSVSNRLVLSYSGTAGIEWKTFTSLPALQQTPLNQNNTGTVDNNGQNRVNYIRGDRSKEQSQTGGIFRNRDSRLGDIANSKILYLGKPVSNYGESGYAAFKRPAGAGNRANMLYVGANDGMLHAFDAATGVEKLAYIPQGIAQGDLRRLTDPNYTHQYFVDGTPFAGDAKVGTGTASANPWKTVLVAGLGAGGKGYVALNVTKPSNFDPTNVTNLTDPNNTDALVIADTTATTDPDIGKMFITPAIDPADASRSSQIVRVNASNTAKYRWALVLGNGYNSTNEAPVLIVQYLDGAKEIKKISPCISVSSASAGVFDNACVYKTNTGLTINGSTSNGLSTPRTVDLNDDGIVDVAYAGDLAGNVWKFDLSSKDPSGWKTSFANQPLFKAKPGQSFTTAPYVDSNFTAGSGVQVHISSGKNLTTADQTSTNTETTYSLWDNSRFGQKPIPNTSNYKFEITDSTPVNTSNVIPDTLIQQTISTSPFTSAGNSYYTSSSNSVDYERASEPDRGWYMDWRIAGQRVLRNSKSFDGQKISIYSTVPSAATVANNVESCTPGVNSEKNYLTILNMFTGKPSKAPSYDLPTTIAATTRAGTTTVELPPGDFVEVKTRNVNGKLGGKVVSACKAGQACKPPVDTPWGSYVGVKAGWGSKQ